MPNVGKSTLFNALTEKKVDISNYPFCTIEPNVGVVQVPDERLSKLAEISHSRKVIPAIIEFVDIAGLVKGAAEGEGLGNKFLSHIKEVDAIAEVVRVFEDPEITHVAGKPDPVSDIEVVEYELILKDLENISKRMEKAEADVKGRRKGALEEASVLKRAKEGLEKGKIISSIMREENFTETEKIGWENVNREMQFLTSKPIIYIFNVSELELQNNWQPDEKIKQKIKLSPWVSISAKTESELNGLEAAEKKEFLKSLGLKESGLDAFIRISYAALGLLTFLTTGEDETRAWTIPMGSTAPRAGRAIHSDFEEKFIRAEVIEWQKLLTAGSWAKVREFGWLRTVGKEYVVQDGDVVEFKI